MKRLATILAAFLSGAAIGLPAYGAIGNAGFEDDTMPDGSPIPDNTLRVDAGFPTGWSAYDPNSILDGGANVLGVLDLQNSDVFPGGPIEGDQAAIVFLSGSDGEAGVEQSLTETLQANTHYFLDVAVGNPASGTTSSSSSGGTIPLDLTGFPGYRIDLVAGGAVLASETGAVIGDGQWSTRSVVVATGDTHSQLGQALGIRLVNQNAPASGLMVAFDDVRLVSLLIPDVSGDANGDGAVDLLDLDILGANFGLTEGATVAEGDFDGNGTVDLLDLDILGYNFGAGTSTSVPEPGSLALLFAGAFAWRRR